VGAKDPLPSRLRGEMDLIAVGQCLHTEGRLAQPGSVPALAIEVLLNAAGVQGFSTLRRILKMSRQADESGRARQVLEPVRSVDCVEDEWFRGPGGLGLLRTSSELEFREFTTRLCFFYLAILHFGRNPPPAPQVRPKVIVRSPPLRM